MKKKLKEYKVFIAAIIAVALLFGVYLKFFGGAENVIANNLASEIEDLKGDNFKKSFDKFVLERYSKLSADLGPEEKARYMQQIKSDLKDINASLDFSEVTTKTEGGVGYVIIKSPVVVVDDALHAQKAEFRMSELEIGENGQGKKHLFFNGKGELEIWLEKSGTKQKVLAFSYEKFNAETNTDEINKKFVTKFSANNIAVLEGRSNTALVKIGSINHEQEIIGLGQVKSSNSAKMEYKDVEAGDFIKMMLGQIPPLTFRANYKFDGDDFFSAYSRITTAAEQKPTPLEGVFTISNFEILLGNSGVQAVGQAKFIKENTNNMPFGGVKITIQNYKTLRDLVTGFIRTPAEKIGKIDEFFAEIAVQDSQNYILNLTFDGSEQIRINGKTVEEVKNVSLKYFPAASAESGGDFKPSADGAVPAVPSQVKRKPLM